MNGRRDIAAAFGTVLRAARRDAGLSQEEMAEQAGLDRTYPSLLERGRRTPTLLAIVRIAEALSIEPGTLVNMAAARLKFEANAGLTPRDQRRQGQRRLNSTG